MTSSVVRREGGLRSYILGVMSYMGVLCFVPLVTNSDDEFVRFHARQGLIIWIWSVLAVMALYLPGLGKVIFSMSAMGVLVISIIGVVSVVFSKVWKLPVIHNLASKL